MNIPSISLILFRVGLVPIYIFYWALVVLQQQDPIGILTVSISISGALCALSFTAYSNLKDSKKHKKLYLYNLAAISLFKATIYSVIALICYYFVSNALSPTENIYHQVVNVFYGVVVGICYGSGIVGFHYGLLWLFEAVEEPF
ncbi:hypothetical protein [Shewanella baltica]|uniref:hypothetical protein n=1 Tax=Shewanella baltica TaxID=62322 RepID=UPI00014F8920|nr:hypothetical protein [Shewanella baltica]ABS07686.1 hypothetical protein Shew185_1539 [Shewanella baltica OS185]MCS6178197.1 hypothetical protein [Shewanella baltica]MCS6254343.1 hypothetical protein [Shewanella baltica]